MGVHFSRFWEMVWERVGAKFGWGAHAHPLRFFEILVRAGAPGCVPSPPSASVFFPVAVSDQVAAL